MLPGQHFQLCTLIIYEKVMFVRHINYLRTVPKTQMWYSTFCICAKETNTTLNCVPWRVCKYYYCWFDCIAYQEYCDRWGLLWLTGPLYAPFPYKLYVINLLKLPPLLQPKNKRVLMTFIRNINVTMIIWNNCRNWSVSVRSATHKHPPKNHHRWKRERKDLVAGPLCTPCWPQWRQCHCRQHNPAILLERGQGWRKNIRKWSGGVMYTYINTHIYIIYIYIYYIYIYIRSISDIYYIYI